MSTVWGKGGTGGNAAHDLVCCRCRERRENHDRLLPPTSCGLPGDHSDWTWDQHHRREEGTATKCQQYGGASRGKRPCGQDILARREQDERGRDPEEGNGVWEKIDLIGNHIPEMVCHLDPNFLCSSTKTIRQFLGLPTDGSRRLWIIAFPQLLSIKMLKEKDMLTAYSQCFFCEFDGPSWAHL
jgi:hypothetical protein